MQGIKSDYCLRTYDDTNRDCPLGNGIFRSIEGFHQLMAYFFSAQRQYLKGRPYPSGYDNMFFIRRNTQNAQLPQTVLLCSTFSSKTGKSEYVESTFDTIKLAKSGIKSARTKILAFSALFLLHSVHIQFLVDV